MRTRYSLLLAATLAALPAIGLGYAQQASIDEAKAYTVDGLYGDRINLDWTYGQYFGPLSESADLTNDPVGDAIDAAVSTAPELDYDVQALVTAANDAVANHGRDPNRDWHPDSSLRSVRQFGERYRTEFHNRNGSVYAYRDAATSTCFLASTSMDVVEVEANCESSGAKGLADHLLDELPKEAVEGTWLSSHTWIASVGTFQSNERVLLVSANGVFGEAGSDYRLLFERREGVLVPVVIYTRDEFAKSLIVYRYLPIPATGGGQIPFLSHRTELAFDQNGAAYVERSAITYVGPTSDTDDVKIDVNSGAILMYKTALTSAEKQILVRDDPATWPQRILDGLTFL